MSAVGFQSFCYQIREPMKIAVHHPDEGILFLNSTALFLEPQDHLVLMAKWNPGTSYDLGCMKPDEYLDRPLLPHYLVQDFMGI